MHIWENRLGASPMARGFSQGTTPTLTMRYSTPGARCHTTHAPGGHRACKERVVPKSCRLRARPMVDVGGRVVRKLDIDGRLVATIYISHARPGAGPAERASRSI